MLKITGVFPFLRFFDLANAVTVMNVALSFAVVYVAYLGLFSWSAGMMCLATILDFVDGHIARSWLAYDAPRRAFGKHLDSFADLLNFSVAPALVLFLLIPLPLAVLAGSALVLSGVLRLAVFAIKDSDAPVGYCGLPTTYSGILLALAFQSVAAAKANATSVLILMLLIAILQVTNLKLPKFKAIPTVGFIATVFFMSSFFLHYT
ncbi:CDP-alcohol phosphatidyltransferase family protein [Pseudomonas sp. RIT-To-2]|uniref:CDP-alcohol phosphatidyltransferase family protein n=1 Tax=Pseudomonas sp. RIT-To-2 TaxID=3462541 RepID=UPI002412F39E